MSRYLGQHFLIDTEVAFKIATEVSQRTEKLVVEIGAGRGALTKYLIRTGSYQIKLIEYDKKLASNLQKRYEKNSRISVVNQDARKPDFVDLELTNYPFGYTLAGNLPYYAATNIILAFISSTFPPSYLVVMAQKEVAERICNIKYGSFFGMIVAIFGKAERLFDVPATAFKPAPKVESSVIAIKMYQKPLVSNQTGFIKLLEAGFKQTRKKLHNSLSIGLVVEPAECVKLINKVGIDPDFRPGDLSFKNWMDIFKEWTSIKD